MSTELMLDAAYPPSPDEWVSDLQSVNAKVAAFYAYGPIANYTSEHIAAAGAAGIRTLPIIVPASSPGNAIDMLRAVVSYPTTSRTIAWDIEAGSLPPAGWLLGAYTAARVAGFTNGQYGQQVYLDQYAVCGPEWRWLAAWTMSGKYEPIPTVTAGDAGHQYANDVRLAHGIYDFSIIETEVLGEAMDTETLARLHNFLDFFEQVLSPNFQYIQQTDLDVPTILTDVASIAASLKTLEAPTVDAAAVAAALATHPEFVSALAAALVQSIGKDLTQAP